MVNYIATILDDGVDTEVLIPLRNVTYFKAGNKNQTEVFFTDGSSVLVVEEFRYFLQDFGRETLWLGLTDTKETE